MKSKKKSTWQIKQIEKAKLQVKNELDNAFRVGGVKARFARIMAGIRQNEGAFNPDQLLLLFIYIVSALVHHARYEGLSQSQISRLINLAYTVLQIQGIQPETSSLSFLYGELHLALSQIYRLEGKNWTAAWEQQLSYMLSRRNPPGGEAFQLLSQGMCSLRLGHAVNAYAKFDLADNDTMSAGNLEKAKIGKIRALRLSGHYDKAKNFIRLVKLDNRFSKAGMREIAWEQLCLEASITNDLTEIISSVQRKGQHYEAVYIVEAFLWARAVSKRHWCDRLPKMQTIARKKDLGARDLGFFLKAATAFEECNEKIIPFVTRLKKLGVLLEKTHLFSSIDRELLFYLAAARWLARNRLPTLATLALWEYKGLSLKLSDGRSADVLNLAKDLLQRPWFNLEAKERE